MRAHVATIRHERAADVATHLRRAIVVERYWAGAALWLGAGILAAYALAAILAPWIAPHDPLAQDLLSTFTGPSAGHLMGTDQYGSDVFSRVLYGLRVDLVFGLVTTYVPMVVGMLVGMYAGYYRGLLDSVTMRLADLTIAMPFIVLVLAIVAIVGPGLEGAYIGIMIVSWALYARLTRAEMLTLREQNFVAAARGLGYSTPRILFRHALPNLVRPNLVFSMADIVLNILVLAGLSFLGVGVQPPTAELGAIIAGGQPYQLNAWWITTLPGLALVVLGIGFSLVGDALADRLGGSLDLPS
jgi:peptide/nickel transport system permease protein